MEGKVKRAKSGWSHSPEIKEKISLAKKGKTSEANREAIRAHHRRKREQQGILSPLDARGMKYGLAPGEYTRMLDRQGGKCLICDLPERKLRGGVPDMLSVDHDHQTGRVRGLLCSTCNLELGRVESLVEDGRLFFMLRYLRADKK